jgi:hypothetical protein
VKEREREIESVELALRQLATASSITKLAKGGTIS